MRRLIYDNFPESSEWSTDPRSYIWPTNRSTSISVGLSIDSCVQAVFNMISKEVQPIAKEE